MNQKTYEKLVAENNKLKTQNLELKTKNVELKNENTNLKIKVENQELHINALNRCIFGSKREYTPKEENIVERNTMFYFWCAKRRRNKRENRRKNGRNNST